MSKNILRKPFRYVFWNAALTIVAINIVVFLLTQIDVTRTLISYLALNVVNVLRLKMFWQFLTYQFCHANFQHLFFNMLGIVFFGISVERTIGSKEFLVFYLSSGIFCGIVSFIVYNFFGYYNSVLLGASGAIYAILFAFATIFPQSTVFVWGIIPVPTPLLVLIYAVVEFLGLSGANVAHIAHLSGFAYAWIYFAVRMGINPLKIWREYFK